MQILQEFSIEQGLADTKTEPICFRQLKIDPERQSEIDPERQSEIDPPYITQKAEEQINLTQPIVS
jgi:hypothetical protein